MKLREDIERMKEIDVSKISDPYARIVIANLWERINALSIEKENAEEREQEALTKKMEAESTARALQKTVDKQKGLLEASLDKIDSAFSRLGVAMLTEQDMKLNQIMAEGMFMKIKKALDNLSETLEDKESRLAVDKAKEEIMDTAIALKLLTGEEKEKKTEMPEIKKIPPGAK